jgi:4-carboxymuconolactone decarboxylase
MRLEHLRPEQLDDRQRALYDVLTAKGRVVQDTTVDTGVLMVDAEGRMGGPFNAMLHNPSIGWSLQEVSRRLRFEGVLPARAREVVILVVAASQRSDYEWAAHAVIARGLGMTDAQIAALGAGARVEFADPVEDAASELAHTLVTTGDADDEVYERTHAALGDAGTVEVATTVGFYQLLAQQLRLFRVPAPVGPWGPG